MATSDISKRGHTAGLAARESEGDGWKHCGFWATPGAKSQAVSRSAGIQVVSHGKLTIA
jgi:hypothetical protein